MSALERGGNRHFRRNVGNEIREYDSRAALTNIQYAPYSGFAKKIETFEKRRKRALTETHSKKP